MSDQDKLASWKEWAKLCSDEEMIRDIGRLIRDTEASLSKVSDSPLPDEMRMDRDKGAV